MITAGLDIGSTTTKAVLLRSGGVLARQITATGVDPAAAAGRVLNDCCRAAGIDAAGIQLTVATGYGRRLAGLGDMVITEIKACSTGISYSMAAAGETGSVIDVGGQDTKVIRFGPDGKVADFVMNDKCAAGTGRFLEVLADKLDMSYEDFVDAALDSETEIRMNSTCAVFAESEVVSLLARGVSKEDIAAAAHRAIAQRIASMVQQVGRREPFCFVGGGALNRALALALEESLDAKLLIPPAPQFVVALGAAIEGCNSAVAGDKK